MQYPHRGEGAAPSRLKGAGGEWKWHVRGQPANSTASLPPLHSCHTPVLSLSLAQLVAQETHTHRLSTCQESRSVYLESLALAVTFTQLYCDCWKGWAQPLPPPPLRGSILLWPWSLPKSPQNLPPALWLPLLSNKLCFGGRGGGSKQVNQGWSLLAGSPPGLRGPQGSHLASGSLRLASGMRAKQERQQSSEITLEGERGPDRAPGLSNHSRWF